MSAKAVSTIGTVLKFGTTSGSLTQLCKITSYPDLIGEPNLLETTDLEDTQQTFIAGVKSAENMQFEANYTSEVWETLKANEGVAGYFALEFGASGADGIFNWQGAYTLGKGGEGVDEVRKMTINIAPTTPVTKATPTP